MLQKRGPTLGLLRVGPLFRTLSTVCFLAGRGRTPPPDIEWHTVSCWTSLLVAALFVVAPLRPDGTGSCCWSLCVRTPAMRSTAPLSAWRSSTSSALPPSSGTSELCLALCWMEEISSGAAAEFSLLMPLCAGFACPPGRPAAPFLWKRTRIKLQMRCCYVTLSPMLKGHLSKYCAYAMSQPLSSALKGCLI